MANDSDDLLTIMVEEVAAEVALLRIRGEVSPLTAPRVEQPCTSSSPLCRMRSSST